MKLEGYISKKRIRFWLNHYVKLSAEGRSFSEDLSAAPREYDGKSSFYLNKLMLDHAIKSLPAEEKICCKNRWILGKTIEETCDELRITVGEYYRYCDKAVNSIYEQLNGEMIGVKKLLDLIGSDRT